jgi:carboxyl-terminal processing protease
MMNQLIILILLLVSACSSTSKFRSLEAYWNETNLTWDDYKELVNNTKCYQNEDKFFACIESINYLMYDKENGWFITNKTKFSLKSPLPNFPKVTGLRWIKTSEKNQKKHSRYLRRNYKKNWIEFYNRKDEFDFEAANIAAIELYKKNKKITKRNEKMHIGYLVNEYLRSLKGPYNYLVVRKEDYDRYILPNKSLVGIGIYMNLKNGKANVEKVIRGGPAHQADIRVQDQFLELKSNETKQWVSIKSLGEKYIDYIKGKEGTKISIKLERGKKILVKELVRRKVVFKPYESRLIVKNKRRFLYLYPYEFYRRGLFCSDMSNELEKNFPYDGVVLDMRNNPGGIVASAHCLSSFFLEDGKILETKYDIEGGFKNPSEAILDQSYVSNSNFKTNSPLIILINRRSVSSAEKVPSTLQDYGRAIIVGERTYGKGTTIRNFKNDEDFPYMFREYDLFMLKPTSYSIRPQGGQIEGVGVIPDVYIPEKPGEKVNKLSKLEERLVEFPWYHVFNFDLPGYKKWKPSEEVKKRNKNLSKCLRTYRNASLREYKSAFKTSTTDLPDYMLIHALNLFECGIAPLS